MTNLTLHARLTYYAVRLIISFVFSKRNVITKLRLFKSYCSSLFISVLWDLSHVGIERLCAAWRKGCRRVWHLPHDARSSLLPIMCCDLPLLDILTTRFVKFVAKCFTSDSFIIRSVVNFGVYEGGMYSLLKRNALFCCHRFNLSFCDFPYLSPAYIKWFVSCSNDPRVFDRASLILELIFLRDGFLHFDNSDFLSSDNLQDFITFLSSDTAL